MPVCSKCKIDKPAEAFSISSKNKSGLQRNCKDCVNEYNRVNQPWKKYQAKNPHQVWCRTEARKLIKAGVIKKGPCVICGATHSANGKSLEFHHPDYRYPAVGWWVCKLCHKNLPKGMSVQECFAFMQELIKNSPVVTKHKDHKKPKKRKEASHG